MADFMLSWFFRNKNLKVIQESTPVTWIVMKLQQHLMLSSLKVGSNIGNQSFG